MTGQEPVAVVGIDCRFPGAPDREAFWDLLVDGRHGVGPVPASRWDADAFFDANGGAGRVNTRHAGFIADPDAFDLEFFSISPREAAAMDPQQRLLLQTAWRAIEDSSTDPARLAGSATGVFVGMMSSEWATLHMSDYAGLTAHRGSGNGYCMAANRISYHLDLKGPSMAVDTACSSSLVAVHMAANAIRAGDCDTALVAGVNLLLTPALSIFYTQAGLSAPDGRCKAFGAGADGIGRGEGVGVVVLRRLADALADGQPVYAVIEGSAVNQDGRGNGITAPNRWSQQKVITQAYERAGVTAADVTFVEGHGTGTTLGDMIEVRALGAAHGGRATPCLLGSVKGNIGHAEGAAGIAGLIKACLAIERRLLPPTLAGTAENPQIKMAEHGMRLARHPVRLTGATVRGAVSSFGLGGTNAHVVLRAAPTVRRRTGAGGAGVLTLSAHSVPALRRNLAALARAVEGGDDAQLTRLAYSTNRVKSSLRHRVAMPAADPAKVADGLRDLLADDDVLARRSARRSGRPKVAFLFTGQGAQYVGMGRALRAACPPFRERLAEVDAVLGEHLRCSISEVALDGARHDGLGVDDTALTQPALFALQWALATALGDLGVEPDVVLGHSVGEFAAACAAGVLTLPEAAALVAERAARMQELPAGGAMVAVDATPERATAALTGEPLVALAAVNGPTSVVLSGEAVGLARVAERLAADGHRVRPLQVSHAFHSPLMAPVVTPLAAATEVLPVRAGRVAFASTLHGRVVDGTELSGTYWAEQAIAPVRFHDALAAVAEREPTHLVEIGPRPVLLGLAARAGVAAKRLAPVPGVSASGDELAATLAALFTDGLDPRWEVLYTEPQRAPRRLPGYVFADTERFWASAATVGTTTGTVVPQVSSATRTAVGPAGTAAVAFGSGRDAGPAGVLAALAEIGDYAPGDLRPEVRLHEDLGFDSIMVMQLGDRLTELLGLPEPIPVADLLPRVTTVSELMAFATAIHQGGRR